MCSELFRIPVEAFGVPIFGFGVLLAIWLAVGGYSVYKNGGAVDAWTTLAFVALAIVLLPKLFPDGLPIRSYGLMMLLGCLSGLWLAISRGRNAGIAGETIMSLAMHMFVAGIVGARLFYVIEYWDARIKQETLGQTIKAALSFTEGGLVVYGSLIGATGAFLYFTRKHKLPTLALADLIAPSLLIGLAFGRVGCLLNGCCYGGVSEVPYAITFPKESSPGKLSGPYAEQAGQGRFSGLRFGTAADESAGDVPSGVVIASVVPDSPAADAQLKPGMTVQAIGEYLVETVPQAESLTVRAFLQNHPLEIVDGSGQTHRVSISSPPERSLPVQPTQIYSAVNAALLCWLLWAVFPWRTRDGQVVVLMLTLYPIARFLLEHIRVDESPVFGTGLSISQNLSLLIFAGAVALWVYTRTTAGNQLHYAGKLHNAE
ncbi:prolipoprotein diacylglyceryl transferase family protein [Adhaeretor mobilis]|uniref:Phosphatidylglycerol--prolipoprotein diacylglyceryl transferase n=1 Tax=Adhaeretor mobilis TaxID=1930276 RepID=A0A517N2J7_9BACT|nr:prolipoprotein diacylglyceryl transferase family protein [Adhaeretor mobilis]QDT01353.1 Prolipoprotein diacylglyceryl transferase [Adhaeretor mobilis]